MPHFTAPETPDNLSSAQVIVVEDGHFCCSPSARWEWGYGPDDSGCLSERGSDGGMVRVYGDWVGEVILAIQLFVSVANLQPLFTEAQLPFHSHQLLHNLHDTLMC